MFGAVTAFSLCLSLVSTDTCSPAGTPGLPGIPGLPGRDGRDGIKGERGDAGLPLRPEETSVKGEKGEPGMTGSLGKRGRSGTLGKPGMLGPPGEPGDPGEYGDTTSLLQSAFSVSRATKFQPDPHTPIRFSNIITNINTHFSLKESKFICHIPGLYYFVFHASSRQKNLCVLLMVDDKRLASFCDHIYSQNQQVHSGGLTVYLEREQKVWLQTNSYNGMFATGDKGDSVFSGFLIQAR